MRRYSHRVDADPLRRVDRYFAERADRPFGDTELASGRTLQPFSIAGQRAAANLLTKAVRALDDDDAERARGFVERAVRLPFDRREDLHPAAEEAHMMLFCLVADELEAGGEGDSRWLDAAIAAQAAAPEAARCTMRDVLVAIDHDYDLTRTERAQLRSVTSEVPDRPELRDLRLSPDELRECILPVLEVCRDYRDRTAT